MPLISQMQKVTENFYQAHANEEINTPVAKTAEQQARADCHP
jgi:hypothetical protein